VTIYIAWSIAILYQLFQLICYCILHFFYYCNQISTKDYTKFLFTVFKYVYKNITDTKFLFQLYLDIVIKFLFNCYNLARLARRGGGKEKQELMRLSNDLCILEYMRVCIRFNVIIYISCTNELPYYAYQLVLINSYYQCVCWRIMHTHTHTHTHTQILI